MELKILAFRQLATYYLDSLNPKCDRHVIILNCILDYDDKFYDSRLRWDAHHFVADWILNWCAKFGA